MTRDEAVQRWPVPKNAPSIAQSTARSRSASSSTTSGFLPPISSWTLAWRLIAASATRAPTPCEPVKEMPSISGWSTIAPPTPPSPITRLNTPEARRLRG
jgi:hypothetical protein